MARILLFGGVFEVRNARAVTSVSALTQIRLVKDTQDAQRAVSRTPGVENIGKTDMREEEKSLIVSKACYQQQRRR